MLDFDYNKLQEYIFERYREFTEKGLILYGILIHPQTFRYIVTDESYPRMVMPNITNNLCGFKVVFDTDMYENEYEFLTRHE